MAHSTVSIDTAPEYSSDVAQCDVNHPDRIPIPFIVERTCRLTNRIDATREELKRRSNEF